MYNSECGEGSHGYRVETKGQFVSKSCMFNPTGRRQNDEGVAEMVLKSAEDCHPEMGMKLYVRMVSEIKCENNEK